ncbi:hypothetical protein BpOF4_04390 [Alkalihalophilus pseudofirmus OF4]|jgi:hypothetical protein|uniref:Uncharacterized protein n=1 Tax=Alkalihalophilus pseudofirmus (strain ATCC BAA-2126 / JCM 17055 / OF4) TaxID=398511 RepID=D3FXV5_ALKPO|nr:hypothetical protein [Alkalihalophilus pseudofirmus]ADC48942.1 hypothetical protein BpOF4_04390 [Alkalihalophilus pseudofirmus OF4]
MVAGVLIIIVLCMIELILASHVTKDQQRSLMSVYDFFDQSK